MGKTISFVSRRRSLHEPEDCILRREAFALCEYA